MWFVSKNYESNYPNKNNLEKFSWRNKKKMTGETVNDMVFPPCQAVSRFWARQFFSYFMTMTLRHDHLSSKFSRNFTEISQMPFELKMVKHEKQFLQLVNEKKSSSKRVVDEGTSVWSVVIQPLRKMQSSVKPDEISYYGLYFEGENFELDELEFMSKYSEHYSKVNIRNLKSGNGGKTDFFRNWVSRRTQKR